jgi:hypothetical protein
VALNGQHCLYRVGAITHGSILIDLVAYETCCQWERRWLSDSWNLVLFVTASCRIIRNRNNDFWIVACEITMTPKPHKPFTSDHSIRMVDFHATLTASSLTLSVELAVGNSELNYRAQI